MGKFVIKILVGIFAILLIIVLGSAIFEATNSFPSQIKFGVTFSPRYATYMKLDWKKVYIDMLDNLKIRNLRIASFWDTLQKTPDKTDFSETDYLVTEAEKRGARVIMVLGERQPRWPECHVPSWAKSLTLADRQENLLEFIRMVVGRYKDRSSIWAWQVENEPLLSSFGEDCDVPSLDFLQKEISIVRNVSNKPIIMTDSGELGFWKTSMSLSDIFGTTLYRQVYNQTFGYTTYPLPPYFYSLKSSLIRYIFAPNNKETIIVELQAEPWLKNGVFTTSTEQAKVFTVDNFKSYVNFAKKTGFDEAYLWGVEWWYFMAEHGHPEYLESAQTLFR